LRNSRSSFSSSPSWSCNASICALQRFEQGLQACDGGGFFTARRAPRLAHFTELDEFLEHVAGPHFDPLPALGGDLLRLLLQLGGGQRLQQGGVQQVGLLVVIAEQVAPQRAARLLVGLERDVARDRVRVGLDFALRQQLAQVVGATVPRRHAGPDLLLSRMVVARGQHHQAIQADLAVAELRHQAWRHRGELHAPLHHQRRDAERGGHVLDRLARIDQLGEGGRTRRPDAWECGTRSRQGWR
jgi:hypothetical protein